MKHLVIMFSVIVTALSSCNDNQPIAVSTPESDTTAKVITSPDSRTPVTEKTYTAKHITYVVREDKSLGASVSRITVLAKDSVHTDSLNLGDKDPVETALLADLDENGNEELFVITRSAGSGTFAHIFGCTRDHQNKLVAIEVPEISPMDQASGKQFEGYMGHDSIYIQNQSLVRSFPVFKPGDHQNQPTGGRRTVKYMLDGASLVTE